VIRILVQQFSGIGTKHGYVRSFQFKVTKKIEENLALDILMEWLQTNRLLIESEHK